MEKTLRHWIGEWSHRKLAHLLWENLWCCHEERADFDWNTAGGWIQNHQEVVTNIGHQFLRGVCPNLLGVYVANRHKALNELDFDYWKFDQVCGWKVWDRLFQSFIRQSS